MSANTNNKRGRPFENINCKIARLERAIGECVNAGDAAGAAALRKFAADNSIVIRELKVEFYALQLSLKFEGENNATTIPS